VICPVCQSTDADCRSCDGTGIVRCECGEEDATIRGTDWHGKSVLTGPRCAEEMATLRWWIVGKMSADEDVARAQREVAVARWMDLRSN